MKSLLQRNRKAQIRRREKALANLQIKADGWAAQVDISPNAKPQLSRIKKEILTLQTRLQ